MKNSILYAVILAGLVLSGCASSTRSSNTAASDAYPTPPLDTTSATRPEITNPNPSPVSSDPTDPAGASAAATATPTDPVLSGRSTSSTTATSATPPPAYPTGTTPSPSPSGYSATAGPSSVPPVASSTSPAVTAGGDLAARMTTWRLSDADIESALNSGVTIVRTKDTNIAAPTSATDDELVKSMIDSKLKADAQTSSANIEVDAKSGEVSLKGSAASAGTIGRAIALSLDTQGVTKVSSDIKVNGRTNPN